MCADSLPSLSLSSSSASLSSSSASLPSSPPPPCSLVSSPRPASEPEPSSPLSDLSQTPSLSDLRALSSDVDAAKRYPSPASLSAGTSGTQTPTKRSQCSSSQSDDSSILAITSSPSHRPAKRRKITIPKPKGPRDRSTKYLNLTKPQLDAQDNYQMERLLSALRKKKKIVVVAGAGISVSAGIPDFRSSNGLFATSGKQYNVKSSGKHLFDASVYKHTASTQSFHNMIRDIDDMLARAHPTPFHHMLASLAQQGRLLRLYSQNIDCLDTSMKPLETAVPLNPKGPWPKTIQLHGGLKHMVCTKCSQLSPFNPELFKGPEPPLCQQCQVDDQVRTLHAGKRSHGIGRLRPRFVLYNEYNPDEEAIGNVSSADLRTRPDAVIVVGTTLKVPGTRRLVKELCQVARDRKDGFTAWINISPEPKGADLKDCWDMVVQSECDEVAKRVQLPPGNVDIGDGYLVHNDEVNSTTNIEISIRSTPPMPSDEIIDAVLPPTTQQTQSIPTPRPSPKPDTAAAAVVKKPKQSKLAFGSDTGTSKPQKAAKSRPRKTKQTKATSTPKTVMDSFKVKKVSTAKASTVKSMDVNMDAKNDSADASSASITTSTIILPNCHVASSVQVPATPAPGKLDNEIDPYEGTISPSSVPKDMRHLIT